MGRNSDNTQIKLSKLSIFAVMLVGWLASGCGATQSGGQPATSLGSITPLTPIAANSQNTICNQMSTTSTRFNASLRTVDGNPNMIRVRITGMTSLYDGNPNANIQFFRWKVVNGVSNLDSSPLSFHIEGASHNGVSGHQYSNTMTGIAMTDVKQIASANFLNVQTAEQFFNAVDIIVHDVSFDYSALKFVLYNGGTVTASNDALMPPFAVNPKSYASTHAPVLNGLHPFANQLNLTDAQYLANAQSFCF